MSKELTQREFASMGAKALRQKYSKRQLRAWAGMGGRPLKLTKKDLPRLIEMVKAGRTQAECAGEFGVVTRTIGRALARLRSRGVEVN
jgi:hypothetical protein